MTIVISLGAVGILAYIVFITVFAIKKNKIVKSMQQSMESLRYTALDTVLMNKSSKHRILIKVEMSDRTVGYYEADRQITFGRSASNVISVDNSSVSKNHCCLYYRNDKLFVQDMNSSNLTIVMHNSEKIALSNGERIELHSGDFLLLGNVSAKIQLFYCVEA